MSFGFSVGDITALVQLAQKTVANARKACGEYAELTHEASSAHLVLRRLEQEATNPESPINRPGDSCRDELTLILSGCRKVLAMMDKVLQKYNALTEQEKSMRKLWQKVRFGNGQTADVDDLRSKITFYNSSISLFLNMVSIGSVGRVEKQMDRAGGDLIKIRLAVNSITAHMLASADKEGSVLTAYPDDEKAVWREFRRELVRDGFSSSVIRKHKMVIQAYIKELGSRGLLDEEESSLPEECFEEADEMTRGTKYSLDSDSAVTADGFSTDTLNMNSSISVNPDPSLNQDEPLNVLDNYPSVSKYSDSSLNQEKAEAKLFSETARVQAYYQPPEQSVDISDGESNSNGKNARSRHECDIDLGRSSTPNVQADTVNSQPDLVEMAQNMHIRTNRDHVESTELAPNDSQSEDSYQEYSDGQGSNMSPVSAMTFENMQILHGQLSKPSLLAPLPKRNHYYASPYGLEYVPSGINIWLYLEAFKDRVHMILACSSRSPTTLKAVGTIGSDTDQTLDNSECDLMVLRSYASSGIRLLYELGIYSQPPKHFGYKSSPPKPTLRFISTICAEFLDANEARWISNNFGDCEYWCRRRLLMEIGTWISMFDEACVEIVARLWLKFGCVAARAQNHVLDWIDGLEGRMRNFPVEEACEEPHFKSADQLYDVCLILYHELEPQCYDFMRRPPPDIQSRDNLHRALSEGIMRTVVLKLDAVQTENDQELRTLRKEICGQGQRSSGKHRSNTKRIVRRVARGQFVHRVRRIFPVSKAKGLGSGASAWWTKT